MAINKKEQELILKTYGKTFNLVDKNTKNFINRQIKMLSNKKVPLEIAMAILVSTLKKASEVIIKLDLITYREELEKNGVKKTG